MIAVLVWNGFWKFRIRAIYKFVVIHSGRIVFHLNVKVIYFLPFSICKTASKPYGFAMCIFGDVVLECEGTDCHNFEFPWLYF